MSDASDSADVDQVTRRAMLKAVGAAAVGGTLAPVAAARFLERELRGSVAPEI
jgi:hypothetical protein